MNLIWKPYEAPSRGRAPVSGGARRYPGARRFPGGAGVPPAVGGMDCARRVCVIAVRGCAAGLARTDDSHDAERRATRSPDLSRRGASCHLEPIPKLSPVVPFST